jgi:outer membrane protein OmpA-like peptidoglycan-associated protein
MSIGRLTVALAAAGALAGCSVPYLSRPDRQVLIDRRCADVDFPIYFAKGSAELSAPARQVIANGGRQAARCMVAAVQVVGLADYKGPAEAGLELSRRRAEQVAIALARAGLPVPSFGLVAAGGAAAPTPGGERADVLIRFKH